MQLPDSAGAIGQVPFLATSQHHVTFRPLLHPAFMPIGWCLPKAYEWYRIVREYPIGRFSEM
jgi:hypothetical protein